MRSLSGVQTYMGWLGKLFWRENADVNIGRDRDGGGSVPADRPASAVEDIAHFEATARFDALMTTR